MKIFFIFLAISSLGHTLPIDPNEEVELIPPVETESNDYEDEGYVPIFVIRRTSGSPFFSSGSGFPFASGFNPFDIFGQDNTGKNDMDLIPSIFDSPTEEETEDIPCGFLCTILKDFDTKLRAIQDDVKDFHETNFDINNSTYTEKVLPDGTVVKVNKTVISDTSDDGSSFFFHSTSLHNIGKPEEVEEDEAEVAMEPDQEEFEEFPAAKEVIPELDDALNEVPEENLSRSKRSDPFSQQQMIHTHPNMIQNRDISANSIWKPLHSDTLVNDIITTNGKRGSLIRIEPDSEFIRENPHNGNVEPVGIENANIWGQQTVWK